MGFSWGVLYSNFVKRCWTSWHNSYSMSHTVWDTPDLVCDDFFDQVDADSACYTLGYTNGGSFQTYGQPWSKTEIPFLMDDVQCESASTNFLSCSSTASDCGHAENVLLTCGMACSDFTSQIDVANNIFTPAAALSTDIGLCRIDESNEKVGILMVRNNGEWGSVRVSYQMILYFVWRNQYSMTHPRSSLRWFLWPDRCRISMCYSWIRRRRLFSNIWCI